MADIELADSLEDDSLEIVGTEGAGQPPYKLRVSAALQAAIAANTADVAELDTRVGDLEDGVVTGVAAGTGLTGGGSSGDVSLAVAYGTAAGTAAEGNDARLSDARTPTAHASSHENGGTDELSVEGLSGELADPQPPKTHAASHATGQIDAITPDDIGAVATSRTVSAGTGLTGGGDLSEHRTIAANVGTTAGTLAAGDDSRITGAVQSSSLGTGVLTFLATPSSANLKSAVTDETGSGALVFATSPTLVTPALGTPASGTLTNCTGRLSANQTADQIATSGTAVAISSTAPTARQVLQASSATAAAWSDFPIVTKAQSADVTEDTSTDPVDIPGLSIVLPHAGTYMVSAVLPWFADDTTTRSMGVGLAYSGTTTFVAGGSAGSTTQSGLAAGSFRQTTMGVLGTLIVSFAAGCLYVQYSVIVSTSGVLKMQFSRSAASITHTSGVMTVSEAN